MNQDDAYKKLFAYCDDRSQHSKAVCETVIVRIKNKRLKDARIGLVVHGIFGVAALILFLPALQYVFVSATQSGFTAYVSLAMSDGLYLTGMWKDFLLSLAQSAPVIEATAVLGIVLVFGYSLKKLVDDVAILRPRSKARAIGILV